MPSNRDFDRIAYIQLSFVEHLAATAENVVFALARDPDGATLLQTLAKINPKVHVLKADMTDPASLQAAADAVAEATGGTLDVLVNNGGIAGDGWRAIDDYASPQALIDDFRSVFDTNVLGRVLTTNAFLPLLRAGARKQVLFVGSGQGDPASILSLGLKYCPSYAVSKCALEMVAVKYAAKYKHDGFTFLTICPGIVKTDMSAPPTDPEHIKRAHEVMASFAKLRDFRGPMEPAESVREMLDVLDRTTPEDSGKFLSHKGKRGDWF